MEKKKLQDYIHFYIGQPCVNSAFSPTHSLYDEGYTLQGYIQGKPKCYFIGNEEWTTWTDNVKLLLSPLFSMNGGICAQWYKLRKEAMEQFRFPGGNGSHAGAIAGAEAVYLLKHGIDLFGLIESGLAIDKTKGKEVKV